MEEPVTRGSSTTRVAATAAVKAAQRLWARLQEADMEEVLLAGRRVSIATLEVTKALHESRRSATSPALRPAISELLNAMLAARRAWAASHALGTRTAPEARPDPLTPF
jgi:hypothetical protein